MKVSVLLKSGLGLVYTTVILLLVYFGAVWLTKYIVTFSWVGAILFWLIGLPIVVGLFQGLAAIIAVPIVRLMKGARWACWLLLLPTLYIVYCFGYWLWAVASEIGGVLCWLLAISWFLEIAWLFIAYFLTAMSAAYTEKEDEAIAQM